MRLTESPVKTRSVASLLGIASVAAFAPFGVFPLIWLTLGGLFALLETAADRNASARDGALIGWFFGFGFFLAGISWIYVSLSLFGGMPAPVAGFATVLFCAAMAFYPALAGALFVRFAPSTGWQRGLFFAALWTLGEWLRGWVLTGFPWLSVGYSQTPPSPLAGFAPVLGVYGVSLLTVLVGTLVWSGIAGLRARYTSLNPPSPPCQGGARPMAPEPPSPPLIRGRSREFVKHCFTPAEPAGCAKPAVDGREGLTSRTPTKPLLALLLLLAAGAILRNQQWTAPQGDPMRVALLQGNIAQDLKWRPEKFEESLRTYYRLMHDNPAQLTVLPETALPVFLHEVPPMYLEEMQKLAARQDGDLIFGIVTGDRQRYTNSAVSLGTSGQQRYDKSHLVPFGEFIPPGFAWFMAMANIPMSEFTRGAQKQAPLNINGQKIAINICYEDAFGEEIIRALPEATLLINISNVAWFGDSLAPAQHLQIARLRALETGRMMLRATNTGMTAIIDADGSVRGTLPAFTRGALVGEVRAYTGSTPYVRWGNWPAVTLSLILLAFAWRRKGLS